jgi:hypothetical protein
MEISGRMERVPLTACLRYSVAAIFALSGVLYGQAQTTESLPSSKVVLQIFSDACTPCHSAKQAAGKLRLDSLEGLAAGGASGAVVVPRNSLESNLYKRITSAEPLLRMPPAVAPLPPDRVAAIKAWIDGGARGVEFPSASLNRAVDFRRDIEPILKRSCYECHSGPRPKSGLRLDAKSAAMKGGLGGEAIKPGDSNSSRLMHRIEGRDGEARMPFGRAPLPAEQISLLRHWIDAGAEWPADHRESAEVAVEKHWAYRPPVRPAVPKVAGPVNNPIDNFVLARLTKEGMTLSPPASKEKLLRRVTLDLTGLPPTPGEIDAFLKDTSRDAYERVVDRLLASPSYGERWARPWLDYARYADTNGYEADFRRTMWKYRDWVINALNQDKPFDQFTIEQLAGDLLPNATVDQKIATGFHRNTMLNEEGGVDKDESHFEVLVDRVNTTASVWLGSTIGCSQCHNHKYDPFTQKEYYQLMAFFSSGAKKAISNGGTSSKYEEPFLEFPTPEQEQARTTLKARIEALETRFKSSTPELEREQTEWEQQVVRANSDWSTIKPSVLRASGATVLETGQDGSVIASGANPREQTYTIEGAAPIEQITGLRIEALPDRSLPRGGPGRDTYGNFVLTRLKVEIDDGSGWRSIRVNRKQTDDGKLEEKRSRHLWTIDASREEKRIARQLVVMFEPAVRVASPARIRVSLVQDSDLIGQSIGRFRLSVTAVDDPSWIVQVRAKYRSILESANRDSKGAEELAEFFRSIAPSLASERDELKKLKSDLKDLKITTALILGEQPDVVRPSDFVRTRGAFSAKGERVYAGVPAVLGSLPPDQPLNRLTLAKWLVDRGNPLTARVAVNRLWEQYFGSGIVETSEDFGSQGQPPTHPELLDWLAVEFMDSGWRMKRIHRLIVTSAAYRQTSDITPGLLKRDPQNRLVSRGPRLRLEAEMIRDVALSASGLLVQKVGGPSVFPPQPPGVWDLPYNDDSWEESKGPDRYRRGIYTFVRRSAPYPAMVNFDATSREACTIRRTRTNTPLQALTTLNDVAFFEAAQALGNRMLALVGGSERDRIDYGFRLCTGRGAKESEIEHIAEWRKQERAYFESHSDEAKRIAPNVADAAEHATWTMLANVFLNMSETLTKE